MADDKGFQEQLIVLEKNRTIDLVFRGLMGTGAALFLTAIIAHSPILILGLHVAIIAGLFRWGIIRQNAYAKAASRMIGASRDGITTDGTALPRAKIADGWYQPRAKVKSWWKKRPAGSTVRLVDKRKRILFEAEVDNEGQAVRMLSALGLAASQKRAEFRAAAPVAATQGRSFLLAIGLALMMMGWIWLTTSMHHSGTFGPTIFLILPFSLLSTLPSKVIVGVDGILQRWLWWKRFTPMSNIVSARADGTTRIKLELCDGKEHTIYTAGSKARGGVYQEHRDLVLARINEAQRAHHELGPGADVAGLVARGTRTSTEWKNALVALGEKDAGYRQAAIRDEDLWRVVEDPRAAADARAGAARLLKKGLDDDGKARVRIAAEATASPKLRVALEAALENEDEAIDEALDVLAAEKPG